MGRHKIQNSPAIRRMPSYMHKLMLLHAAGEKFTSAAKLAEYMELDQIIVRKDFELTGIKGTPGIGYKTSDLIKAIRLYLGWNETKNAFLLGAGSLGSALLGYEVFAEYGLQVSAVFDSDPDKIGTMIHGHEIIDIRRLTEYALCYRPQLGIICVPSSCAQMLADKLIECGVCAFWNFANVCLKTPPDVVVQREVIAGGFAVLSRKIKIHAPGEALD
ncbi:MAG: redox-sensing transcriptional repressor Rex [Lentisphaeria bacterium]|nr:redox-sensing transcriptional repressor Rex [Lentisphaeria bacterium]